MRQTAVGIFAYIVLNLLVPSLWDWLMSSAPPVIGRVIIFAGAVVCLALVAFSNPVYRRLISPGTYPISSTALVVVLVATLVGTAWWQFVIAKKAALRWPQAFDELDKREPYATRIFSLSREKGETISLGPCPGEKCLEFGLGQLVNRHDGLEQEIIIKGDIGVSFDPPPRSDPTLPQPIFEMNAMMTGGAFVPGREHSSAWIALRKGANFRLYSPAADVILTVLDTQADNLKIKLEIKPSSLMERRKARRQQVAPTPDKGVSAP